MTLGEHPPFSPDELAEIRAVQLAPKQIHRLLGLTNAEWITLDRERPAMSPREQQTVIARQQELEVILRRLREAL